jgi:hypothetical protein
MLPFIPFPSVCGDDLKVYKYTMDCYRDALISFGAVTVECGDVRMFTPLGLNLLASLIHNLHLQGREIVFIPPSTEKTLQYLADQGFFDEFQFASSRNQLRQARRSTSVMLRRMHEFVGSYPIQVADWLSRNSAVPQAAVEDMVAITLPELMNNVFDHSSSPIGCCVCAQAYKEEGRLTLAVTDLGIGFLESLLPRYGYLNWRFISRDGKWKQLPNGKLELETLSFPFPGTCINMRVPTALLSASSGTLEHEHYD